jgi:hypothetical protein
MKALDYALMSLLAGMTPQVVARTSDGNTSEQQTTQTRTEEPDCTEDACTDEGGLLMRLHTRSYDDPVTQDANRHSSSDALQPDRRVTVVAEPPGNATVVGHFSVALPNGGVIWAIEDPELGQAELSVSATSVVAFENGRILRPVPFFVRGNYTAFIARFEISIYRASDADLIEAIATVPVTVANVAQTEWGGALPTKYSFRPGDELVYVLRAYDKSGAVDETFPHTIQLVTPQEAAHSRQQLRDSAEGSLGTALTLEQATAQSLLDSVFAENGLRQQNIPIYGSRIRLQGRHVPQDTALTINGERYPVDQERKFVAEYLVPVGRHSFDIGIAGGEGDSRDDAHHTLDVDVSGRYFFGIGIVDVTFTQNNIGGSVDPLAVDTRYQDDIFSDGRLAFYGKAKLRGRYLVTAQADTAEHDLEHLFDGFARAEPRDVFRRLDPDLYYPIYGDDSTTYRDVDTMGRFYARVDWDKNQALWGNYATGFTGTEYAQYVRSLYGAALNWRSQGINAWGDPETEVRAFGSQAETAPGHNEFIGTGGSLYYLRNTDILPGSDMVVLEVRDLTTGRVENRIPLQRGADYEIDALQGRILLTRALTQLTRDNIPTLTRDASLDGFEQRLVVDYEWLPSEFDDDNTTAGLRAKQWFGDHVGLGVTYVDENRAGEDYSIAGGDLTLQAGKGTYLKAEYVQTRSFTSPVFFSDNGGFTFTRISAEGAREGEAKSLEARANFKELGWTEQDWAVGAWHHDASAGYSMGRYPTGVPVTEYGAEILGNFTPNLGLYARYSRAESGADALTQAQATLEWRIDDFNTLSGEIRRVDQDAAAAIGAAGVLGAFKYARRFGTSVELYGLAQLTLDDDSGRYVDNDALTLGGKYLYGDRSSLGAELTMGDRGDAALVNAEYQLSPEHTLYGGYIYSTDSTEYHSLFNPNRQNGWTLGQRWRLSNQVNIFNESQFLKERSQSGLAHTFGIDFYPAHGWSLGLTVQSGELESTLGLADRRAVSLSGGRSSPDTEWQSKLEWRRDTGAEQREQWVSTNRLTHKINESWRIAARVNYSRTRDHRIDDAGARFMESNLGFAWRPWKSQRWALYGRYTYLYDLATLGQTGGAQVDQKSEVLSLEGVHKHDAYWEYAAKVARRTGDVRYGRSAGEWLDSRATFAAVQVRYGLHRWNNWHALAEYRWLMVDDGGGTRQGWLAALDRDINKYLRIGLGYNFTEFSDDLTDFDYHQRGWFVNLTGSY